ncbi:DUF2790 domain-containing protein [Pseudomonas petrae]|uniref:DUF2790 domain-containing protein n=1 Tax=Pseudomonas petrae TaxID=2912190 RepID=A0ABS9I1H8_9PSED|nr:DUF2790 domain-containing protein [Pseudomonas petrae]MCF7532484.1 DUF2790 domain-containing protein [Pseudomonas petrae]MCF7536118.1 DUF2790 domain-containing protein [Pseudomonas petrae]MCF7541658.1 DUF2790 domain-containing protein [Pseudomonas petrae]MCF7557501.1 DUF2790 domain-containing protein [Pseudomonas petrae]
MKNILLLALSLTASFSAFAQDVATTTDVVHYKYGMHLDIAKVIHITEAAPVCAPTPVQMTYQDSQGQTHALEYSIIGGGCTN